MRGGERTVHLRGNESTAHGLQGGMPPEIAHEAAPWAFTIGEKHGEDLCQLPLAIGFGFNQPLHRWIDCQTASNRIQIGALRQNPPGAPGRVLGEWRVHPVGALPFLSRPRLLWRQPNDLNHGLLQHERFVELTRNQAAIALQ